MQITISVEAIYKWITLFFWRLWASSAEDAKNKTVGVPYNRDPDNVCEVYEPFKGPKGDCQSDGHYLCRKCKHFVGEYGT